jgi:hypothetical protein
MSDKTGFDVLDYFHTSAKLEKDGAKMYLYEDKTGEAYFLVRPYPNDDRTRMISELYARHHLILDKAKDGTPEEKKAAEELDTQLTAEVNATHILVGCGGMNQKYSLEFGKRCLLNSRIRDRILGFAMNLTNYKLKEEEIKKK